MISAQTDLSDFEALVSSLLDSGPYNELGRDLAEDAESYATRYLDAYLYSQPIRGGYERTGKLRESTKATHEVTQDGLEVTLRSVGGAGGRAYASFVSLGTYGSRIEAARALSDARDASSYLEPGPYPRSDGLEARAFPYAAMGQLERGLEAAIYQMLASAGR